MQPHTTMPTTPIDANKDRNKKKPKSEKSKGSIPLAVIPSGRRKQPTRGETMAMSFQVGLLVAVVDCRASSWASPPAADVPRRGAEESYDGGTLSVAWMCSSTAAMTS